MGKKGNFLDLLGKAKPHYFTQWWCMLFTVSFPCAQN